VPIVLKFGSLNLLEPSGPVKACNGIALPFYLIRDVVEGFGDFKGQVIISVKYSDNLVLLTWKEMVLQGHGREITV
jgi:hypothetical protein